MKKAITILLAAAMALGLMVPLAGAATLRNSATVTVSVSSRREYLSKSTGGTIGGGYWEYTSNDGIQGTAYCVNWGLLGPSSSKRLPLQAYNRSPHTMGAFANGYPQRSLEQFQELHAGDVRGIENLTEVEYQYATQLAVWATCGQLAVPGTAFTAGRASVVVPTSDAQQIRIYDSIAAILQQASSWTQTLYTGMYLRAEENADIRGVEIVHRSGLEGAANSGQDGIRKETIGGTEYYTRTLYVSSATSTWIDGYTTKVYSTDAPQGTIFTAENGSPLETEQQNGITYYKVDTSQYRETSLNANGIEFYGAFKLCLPVDSTAEEGALTVKALGGAAQYNLYLAYNSDASEQSFIVSDPGYITCDAVMPVSWTRTGADTASLRLVKSGEGGAPLEGVSFTLTGDRGTVVTGATDRDGVITWQDLPVDESYTLSEDAAPEGYTLMDPVNLTLTPGTNYKTVVNHTERVFTIRKVDAQNGSALEGAVFRFEQIDGDYVTTAATGFDGALQFVGDALPYGSYRVTEVQAPAGYEKDAAVETVEWDGAQDVTLTFQNVRQPALIVSKVDGVTGVSLPGAVFNLYKDGALIGSAATNDSGEFRFPLVAGEGYYEVAETVAPDGYQLDRTRHGIYIDPYDPQIQEDPVLTVENFSHPSLRIIKVDQASGQRMPGVTFALYHDGALYDTLTTGEQGEINLYNAPAGAWLVQEVAAGDDHVVNSIPQQIELEAGQRETQTLVFFNQRKPGIHLVKVDSQTMRSIPGVRFEFKQVGGSFRQEFVTGENGEIDLSKLEPGAYEVRELEAPEGYLVDDGVRVVQIRPDETANFVFTNTPMPSLRLIKVSSDGAPLAGVHFRIARVEDGSHYLDRVTDENGEINVSGLEPGVYSVVETATVSGHILDTGEFHVELFPGETSTLTIENQKRPSLVIYKTDADTGAPVPGTVFLVEAAGGHSVDEVKTDTQGRAVLDNLLPGVYQISEKSVPAPYLLDAESQMVTLYANREHTVYFENHKKPTLTIQKVDSITGSPIEGAKFQVWYGSNDTETGELDDLGTYFTGANGQIVLEDLRDGWYRVTELEPAPGFTIREPATQEFYIQGGESKTVTFQNVPLSAIAKEDQTK